MTGTQGTGGRGEPAGSDAWAASAGPPARVGRGDAAGRREDGGTGRSAGGDDGEATPLRTRRAVATRRIGVAGVCVSLLALLAAVFHVLWPGVRIDGVTAVLLIAAGVPWLGGVFSTITFPGGTSVTFRDLQTLEERVRDTREVAQAAEAHGARLDHEMEGLAATTRVVFAGLSGPDDTARHDGSLPYTVPGPGPGPDGVAPSGPPPGGAAPPGPLPDAAAPRGSSRDGTPPPPPGRLGSPAGPAPGPSASPSEQSPTPAAPSGPPDSRPARVPDPTAAQVVADLARRYTALRTSMASGPARTAEQERLFAELLRWTPRVPDPDVRTLLGSRDPGTRLVAIARLNARPDPELLDPLAESVLRERLPFLMYWGLEGLGRVVDVTGPERVSLGLVMRLRKLLTTLPSDTDRRGAVLRLLTKLDPEGHWMTGGDR